ncbi:uncharacterized protein LOC112562046 isoform X2 [Pomacea canaliculata]|nr:uncharacterized protein LOC112562046 isoform X2 [Pomacea canaliculata]
MTFGKFSAAFSVLVIILSAQTTSATSTASCRHIDAAFRWRSVNRTYFFSGDEAIVFSDYHHAEEDVVPVTSLAPNFPSDIEAAVGWFKKNRSFFFKGCYGYMLNEKTRRLRRHRLRRYGLPCDVDAAERLNSRVIRVFKGCTYWHLQRQPFLAVEAGDIRDLGLPCHVDAAITWVDGNVYIIKDDLMWTIARPAETRPLDEWNLCSWNICPRNVSNVSLRDPGAEASDVALTCNGDPRLCHLNFDQVTLAGSHNAGSGFDGGFGLFFDCWARNQGLSVLQQLRHGIRFLDVDTSWQHCGLLGTFHSFFCGGPVCRMLKQVKQFLQENRQEIVAINFNHEMQDMDRVMPALLRQVTSQLGVYVNTGYRDGGTWPTLGQAVLSNKRLFVFIDKRVTQFPEYATAKWIHSEDLLKSTWRSDTAVSEGDCTGVLRAADDQCRLKGLAPILEVSVLGSSTICVSSIAKACHPLLHQVSRACAHHRHAQNKAPNVLLVDYPEMAASDSQSVVSAAFHQNLRNLVQLSSHVCHVSVDAVMWDGDTQRNHRVYFFSGDRVLTYNWQSSLQESAGSNTEFALPTHIDAGFQYLNGSICFTRGCDVICRETLTSGSVSVTSLMDMGIPCHVDAAFIKGDFTLFFKECQYWKSSRNVSDIGPRPVTDFGPLPCNLTAAFVDRNGISTYFFKGGNYWNYTEESGLSGPADILDNWSLDLVHCSPFIL